MRTINQQFWQDKSVFITGHTGFKGSWLTYLLRLHGAKIYGFSLEAESKEQFYNKAQIDSVVTKSTIADIRNREKLHRAFTNAAPDIVFHLAAQPLVRYGYEHPLYTFDVNVMGTANILDVSALMNKPMAVISITTDKVYQNKEQIWSYRESDPLGGTDPYSASKACAEIVIESYMRGIFKSNQTNVNVASVRAGNVIGGGDWAEDRLIPDFMRQSRAGGELLIRNPNATRPWQHVLDCLMGYILLAESLYVNPQDNTEPWNFGPSPGDEWSVRRVVNYLSSNSDTPPRIEFINDTNIEYKEHLSLSLDSTKAIKRLGWLPRLSVRDALDYTIREYNSLDNSSFLNAVEKNINDFLSKSITDEH